MLCAQEEVVIILQYKHCINNILYILAECGDVVVPCTAFLWAT